MYQKIFVPAVKNLTMDAMGLEIEKFIQNIFAKSVTIRGKYDIFIKQSFGARTIHQRRS